VALLSRGKNFSWTEGYANTASLAPLLINGDFNFFLIN
jgi:hypothetical protein